MRMEEGAEVNFSGCEDEAKYMCMKEEVDINSSECRDAVKYMHGGRGRRKFWWVRKRRKIYVWRKGQR